MAVARREKVAATGTLRIGLFDPGMSILHRVGLAGLWLTLDAIDRDHPSLRGELQDLGGSWTLQPNAVEFAWTGDGKAFFGRLIRESFRLTGDGRIWFLGLGDPNGHRDQGVTMQEALLNTFLQHGRTRQSDPSREPGGAVAVEVDGETLAFRYHRVRGYAHQMATFDPSRPQEVVGWQFPGGAVRHAAFPEDTALMEPPGLWLALLYAPVGAIYFRVRSRVGGVRPAFCMVLPDVADLAAAAQGRRLFLGSSARDLVVSGSADAALRVLAELEAARLLRDLQAARCQVTAFGVAPWAKQQKTRVDVFDVERTGRHELEFYRIAAHLLPALPRPDGRAEAAEEEEAVGQPQFETSPVLDQIARNLVEGKRWWQGFTDLMVDPEIWRQMQSYRALQFRLAEMKGGGLAAVVAQKRAFDDEAAKTIVRACQEAWRRRMGALAERARERGEPFDTLVRREFERLRISFAHCKNSATFRAALTDFWSRAGGPIPELQRGWTEVLPYLSGENWTLARDLALLALVSYAPAPSTGEETGPTDER